MTHIPTPWPSPQILDQLVQNSSGYFVYASTIIKFVDDEYFRPSRQLDIIIQKFVPHPFAALDQLYIQILSAVPSRHYPILYDILSVIIHLPAYLSAEEMEDLLGLEPGDVSLILRPLHSVLALRSDRGVEVHHASFRDFLGNQQRSSNFYVGSPQHRAKVAGSFLRALAYKYEDQQKNAKRHGFRGYIHHIVKCHQFFILLFVGSSQ
ncbi:hypothetical protein DFH08DRAFT_709130 [Mycena albidolilacea]|uniref:Uncharacterized protein n=1 Tax=Mycena albidolilacea TaxID=1033008 RepID=A0AAD6ZMD1_9AGAR|nr:hypothetical protein DFH08DRAFT_709130 [Mycena albidolilacea]